MRRAIADGTLLRGPETGLVTLRGRIGGGGALFHFGEATVTRATIKLPTARSAAPGRSAATGRRRGHPPSSTRWRSGFELAALAVKQARARL